MRQGWRNYVPFSSLSVGHGVAHCLSSPIQTAPYSLPSIQPAHLYFITIGEQMVVGTIFLPAGIHMVNTGPTINCSLAGWMLGIIEEQLRMDFKCGVKENSVRQCQWISSIAEYASSLVVKSFEPMWYTFEHVTTHVFSHLHPSS